MCPNGGLAHLGSPAIGEASAMNAQRTAIAEIHSNNTRNLPKMALKPTRINPTSGMDLEMRLAASGTRMSDNIEDRRGKDPNSYFYKFRSYYGL